MVMAGPGPRRGVHSLPTGARTFQSERPDGTIGCADGDCRRAAPVVVLPATHALAEHVELTIAAPAPHPILWWKRDALPGTHDALVSACRRAGFESPLIDLPDVRGVLGKVLADGV